MKNLIISFFSLLIVAFVGCTTTENRKVEIRAGLKAPDVWWRVPYTAERSVDNPWDMFVFKEFDELEYFENNVVLWPKDWKHKRKKPTGFSRIKKPTVKEVY